MNLTVIRKKLGDKATIGNLLIDGVFFCYTLEDVDRGLLQTQPLQDIAKAKIFGSTAIPLGTYDVGMTYSDRFKKTMPQILNVPGFEGIRIHAGNSDVDTHGCLLVGRTIVNDDFIGDSKDAFNELYQILFDKCKIEKVTITYKYDGLAV